MLATLCQYLLNSARGGPAQFSGDRHPMMAVISVFPAKDNFNAARMIARTACPASAFAAAAFAIAAGL
jgi:hypothetical protein